MRDKIKAVVFDWAGTTIDYGCLAPARVFQEVFARKGVPVTEAQARGPMGAAKRDHIAQLAALDDVSKRWIDVYGAPPNEEDVDAMYAEFLPLQLEILGGYTDLIPGTVDVFRWLKTAGIAVGSTTGYTRELMSVVVPAAQRQGYEPDVVVCSDDVRHGRPAPWMLYEALHRLNIYPAQDTIKVDDTPVGILAGKNAGAITVAVIKTGNMLGLSQAETNSLDANQLASRLSSITAEFAAIGTDFIIESIAELPRVIGEVTSS